MRNKLLLTTALVAFAMPTWAAETYNVEQAISSTTSGVFNIVNSNTRNEVANIDMDYPAGVLWVKRGVTLTVDGGSVFDNNKAEAGTIYVSKPSGGNEATLIVKGTEGNKVTFSNNEAYFDGGAIASMGNLSIEHATFEYNKTSNDTGIVDGRSIGGGAIALGAESNSSILSISSTSFISNSSDTDGGAIGTRKGKNANNSAAKLDIEATFTSNSATNNGGAIYNTFYTNNGLGKGDGVTVKGTFTSNTAGKSGGAIYNDGSMDNWGTNGNNGGVMTIISGSKFDKNSAQTGGALFNTGRMTIEKDVEFTSNTATNSGGAIYNNGAITTGNNVKFDGNTAFGNGSTPTGMGGAIYSEGTSDASRNITIGDSAVFNNNQAYAGSAMYLFGENAITIGSSATFSNNKSVADKEGKTLGGGGAISIVEGANSIIGSNNGSTILNIGTNATFSNNIAGYGAAISNSGPLSSVVLQSGAKFTNNSSTGGVGGAVYNNGTFSATNVTFENNSGRKGGALANYSTNATGVTINGSTFSGNTATEAGGAIYNKAGSTLALNGTNVFSDNMVGTTANDIYNDGTLNVAGSLTLDGGITGNGAVNFLDGSKLTINLGETTIAAKTVSITNSKLIFANDVTEKTYDFIKASQTGNFIIDVENSLYNIEHKGDGKIYVEAKSTDELASSLGATSNEANALIAVSSNTNSSNEAFNNVAKKLSLLAQSGDASVASEAKKLGATDTPVVSGQEASMQGALFGVVSSELSGAAGAMARGRSSGDYIRKATAWVRGLYNKADLEKTRKADGFSSDTYGVAMGVDAEISKGTRLGIGYANAQTDIETAGSKTDVDTDTLFVYSKYKPSNWYINSMLAYSWSKYDDKKSVLGVDAGAKYDVDTIALQAMYGYEAMYRGYEVTPEAGLRYMHINQDAYTNKLGSKVAENSDDVLTAILGVKAAKRIRLNNCYSIKPELSAAVTYDLYEADNSANVLLANGAAYNVKGESLDRLGFELGAKVKTKANPRLELSGGYMTRLRKDYQDHTIMFDAKYSL